MGRRPLEGALGSLHSSRALGLPSDPSLGSPLPQKGWSPPRDVPVGAGWAAPVLWSSRKWADDEELPVQTPHRIPGPRDLLL